MSPFSSVQSRDASQRNADRLALALLDLDVWASVQRVVHDVGTIGPHALSVHRHRSGCTPSPRKLHLVFRLHIGHTTRASLRTTEDDDTVGEGRLVWVHYKDTAGKALFPPVPLAELADPTAVVDSAQAWLTGLDDSNYQWI